ncbi:STM4013/SEN3800 family hydrolase [Lignipirellula cremea]|uniref:Sulfatase n=1 Tax=Lignipirellula cremea TaxID=2528010 RepID=A0A518DP48_9BACT|nr:STM4013/SEN3800 family hydrolase [Lignipirellula cremea]QDU93612.1 hypothetical protein Pla8534_13920 [Lignipirellula cremea]
MLDAQSLLATHDLLLVTLDTLRWDVAEEAWRRGETPVLAQYLPQGWERRHSPGSFTYAAHHAIFAGFLPTPASPGKHPRLFACRFPGSETSTAQTCVFEAPDLPSGLRERGFHTICIGGVGFFNKLGPLGSVLPGLFEESHWSPALGVTDPESTRYQVDLAIERIEACEPGRRLFLFLNVSALHQPNCHYLPGATVDTRDSQRAALAYVDQHLPRLIEAMRRRAPLLGLLMSDHGVAYGEDGYHGHRLAHQVVWDVPYGEFVLPAASC